MDTVSKTPRRHDWKAIVKSWESSDLSKAEFCRQNKLPISGFYKAFDRYRRARDNQDIKPQFARAKVVDQKPWPSRRSEAECIIEFPNKARMILSGISADFLRDLLMRG